MSAALSVLKTFNLGNLTFSEQVSVPADLNVLGSDDVPAAKAGTLSTRTDNDTGILTLAADHGVLTGDRIDVYWEEAGVKGQRLGMTVGTVAGTSVPIDSGAGDNLPTAAVAVTASVPLEYNFEVDGDDVVGITAYAEKRGAIVFEAEDGSADDDGHYKRVFGDASMFGWHSEDGDVNPFVGAVIRKAYMSHSDSTAAASMRFGIAYNKAS